MEASSPVRNTLYPVFLKLDQLETLVIGGGNVGLEKLQALLSNSPEARVTIVAPAIREELSALSAAHTHCRIFQRRFEEADLLGKHLVICASDDRSLHERVKSLAAEKQILVNVADTPDLCDLYLGSIVQKGSVKIAISTNGKSPTIAKRLKEFIDGVLPEEMEELLDNMQRIRNSIKGGFGEKVKRLNEITRELAVSGEKNG